MNITNKDIDQLTFYAKNILKGSGEAQPEDIVQDAILEVIERGGELFIHEAKAIVRRLAYGEKSAATNESPNAFCKTDTTRTCKKCLEDLPIGLFPVLSYKDPKKKSILSAYCRDCTRVVAKENYRRKNPIVKKRDLSKISEEEKRAEHIKRSKESYERLKLIPGYMASKVEAVRRYQERKKVLAKIAEKSYLKDLHNSVFGQKNIVLLSAKT